MAQVMAKAKSMSVIDVIKLTTENASRAFNIPVAEVQTHSTKVTLVAPSLGSKHVLALPPNCTLKGLTSLARQAFGREPNGFELSNGQKVFNVNV